MPTTFLSRFFVIAVVLFAGLWAIFPQLPVRPLWILNPSVPFSEKHNLKPGIDMVGGTSLLYEIKVADGQVVSSDLSTQVMDALKKRVDPEGVKNLVWRPQGPTRLEIQMPRSGNSAKAEEARAAYSEARTQLEATTIRLSAVLDTVTRLQGQARQDRLNALALDSATRKEAFAAISKAADELAAARTRKDAAAQAKAELEMDKFRALVEPTSIDVLALEQKLNVIEESKEKGQPIPQDVQAEINKLIENAKDFPSRQKALDAFIKTHADFFKVRNQIDDSADLKRLLQGSGVLEYHVLVDPSDPRAIEMVDRLTNGMGTSLRSGDTAKWGLIEKPDQFRADGVIRNYGGRTWVLLDLLPEKSLTQKTGQKWALKGAMPRHDPQTGETQVAFNLDATGGIYMGRLTAANIKRPMAIVLDDKVISAPTIQSQINDSGVITGRYTKSEISYLVNTLNAGSLPATLAEEPISERTVGPQLGADNLRAGFLACGFGLVAVAIFLIGYYYLAGVVAYIAVCINLLLILGSLAALNATFTLPSVAALVLSLGAAVDSNVLIFERLREEQQRGFPIKMALRNSYDRAFSAILDSNVVTGITSIVLYVFGSEEVKGFGLTLLLGIATSLFTALFVTKTIFGVLVEKFNVRRLGSLPQTFPAWDRALKPNINWMSKVWIFGAASFVLVAMGLGLFGYYTKQGRMMDIEFSSGTAVTIDLKKPLSQGTVRDMLDKAEENTITVTSAGVAAEGAASTAERRMTVKEALPAVLPVAVGTDDMSWEIVTPNADVPAVRAAILEVFKSELDIRLPSTFKDVGASIAQVLNVTVLPVEAPPVGRFVPEQWGAYRGGVAIYLDELNPPLSPIEIQRRITNQRLQPGSSRTLPAVEVFAQTPSNVATSEAVVMAVDTGILSDEDREKWRAEVAEPLWKLVNEAVNRPPSLAKVSSFNPQVAGSTTQDAFVALVLALIVIMGYIWIRFGNLKYGAATVVALLHDSLFVIGALGFAHLLADSKFGNFLLLEATRINLTVVAAVLTVMGYSMADTIVVFDRIRELRGQRGVLTPQVINDAINQTLSRTLLTAGTTIATLFVMYIFGGPGIHGFTYVLLIGILVGTYSSIAIAAPLLMIGIGKDGKSRESEKSKATGTQLQKA